MTPSPDVDRYINAAPPAVQVKLHQLRSIIRDIAPEAEEKISYGMPFYGYHGRLVYFAFQQHHLGLYLPPPIIENHQKELKRYGTTKSAVHLPLDEKLPVALIQTLIQARMRFNEEAARKK